MPDGANTRAKQDKFHTDVTLTIAKEVIDTKICTVIESR